jgi:hypothetical protein
VCTGRFFLCFIMQSGNPCIVHELSNQFWLLSLCSITKYFSLDYFIQHSGSTRSFCLVQGELSWLYS